MKKIVVVGANHAGTAAINTILDNYPDCELTVFDSNSNISFLGCGMALWIGNQIEGSDQLFYCSADIMQHKGATVHMETAVQKIDYDNQKVFAKTKEGKEIEVSYDSLILATGSLPISPNIPGMDLQNVQFVNLFSNAQEGLDKLQGNKELKRITVVGAGYIGVELAEAFKRNGKEVLLVDSADTCLSGYFDREFTDVMTKNLRDNGVQVEFNQTIVAVEGNGKVEAVVTNKQRYETDMVVFAIGFKPNNGLGKDTLELFKNGAYIVDKNQKTSKEDVYDIGDCATVFNNVIDDIDYIALATNAVRSGVIAGHNAAGTPLQTVGVQGSNGIRIWDLNMVSTGFTLSKAKAFGFDAMETEFNDLQKPAFVKEDNAQVTLKIVYDKKTRRVLGAQMASTYDVSMAIHMFSLAIQEKVTIDKLKLLDIFFLPHFNQPYNYITMAALNAK